DVKKMLVEQGFYDKEKNENGKGITHQYNVITQSGQQLIIDHTADLTWQQSGSEKIMTYDSANAYIAQLRRENYGGHSDWRLPTLEEAMSLMQPEKNMNGLYIDPEFDRTQSWIWTADTSSTGLAWVVYFGDGFCGHYQVKGGYHVRAVRSGR
ncbi:DUF1566 domain-containing protein, partial [bacterium]|nr:DUF1566 domain-containing protein [bacterium]